MSEVMQSLWTEERVALLKKLWAEGLSFAQIAAQLGEGITRNAAISKAKRIGIPDRPKARKVAAQSKAGTATTQKLKPKKAAPPQLKRSEPKPVDQPQGNPWGHRRKGDEPRLSLLELTEHTCKWPVGDPLEKGFGFCGAAKTPDDGPYCAVHKQRAAFRD